MVETQDLLKTGIGTEEATRLKPAKVKILVPKIVEVGERKAKKVICSVLHPDTKEPIEISSVKWENKGKLEISGLWVNLDSQNQIRKGSALATFLNFMNAKTIGDMKDKEVLTIEDENGYLVFKGY